MYANLGEGGVFKTELRPAEVDPRFKIWPRPIVLSKIKDTLPILVRSLALGH